MKLKFTFFGKTLLAATLFLAVHNPVQSQTTLVAGDIAFTGYNASSVVTDGFSFVLLRNIAANTQINFTDNGWLASNNFRAGEQTLTFTAGAAIQAGKEIRIFGAPSGTTISAIFAGGGNVSAGTCTGNMLSLNPNGDQVLAYQGAPASPTFISAIHMNVYNGAPDPAVTSEATWEGDAFNGFSSDIPNGLTSGVNAIWIGVPGNTASERNNARFTCSGSINTVANVRTSVNTKTNWAGEFVVSGTEPGAAYVIPSACAFLGIAPLPVKLESFSARLNSDKTSSLLWSVTSQEGISEYIIEESADGSAFRTLGTVTANNEAAFSYSFNDAVLSNGKNYYRLKIIEQSGKITYSNIAVITLKENVQLVAYPNPVKDQLTIQQFGALKNTNAVLINHEGRIMKNIRITSLQQQVDLRALPAGMYTLKLEDGTILKVAKQ
jgi:Secretion system C-terminal sorting domain